MDHAYAFIQEESWLMPFTGIIDPEQLALLTAILDSHCRARGIADAGARDEVAVRLVSLFGSGLQTAEELTGALLSHDRLRPNASAAEDVPPGPAMTSQCQAGQ